MHMADALLSPPVAGVMGAASVAVAALSIKKVGDENDMKKIPVMGVMGAFVFATQMINFTIPGTGSSGHLCGGMLLAAMLGPYSSFLTMIGVLLIQSLMFADGGLMALGANVWNMAFYGCFVGYFLVWKLIMRNGIDRKKIAIASIVGCIITLQMGAFSVTVETLASGITELPFALFVATMQPIHLAIGLIEGLITTAVLIFIYEARPELLQCYKKTSEAKKGLSRKKTLILLAIIAGGIGGALSLAASSNPDGLEWSIEKITGDTELANSSDSAAYDTAQNIQDNTSVLADYNFKDSETGQGTAFSGLVGSAIVLGACAGGCFIIVKLRKRSKEKQRSLQNE